MNAEQYAQEIARTEWNDVACTRCRRFFTIAIGYDAHGQIQMTAGGMQFADGPMCDACCGPNGRIDLDAEGRVVIEEYETRPQGS